MNKKEFIQQFIIHSAGPMLAVVNESGEQRFDNLDVEIAAKLFADKLCEGIFIPEVKVHEAQCEIGSCWYDIRLALEHHQGDNDWCEIESKLNDAIEHIKKAGDLLDMANCIHNDLPMDY